MKFDIKVPAVGESISEGIISQWMKKTGDTVKMNDVLFLLETDKASVDIVAENEGVLTVNVPEKQTVLIGSVVGSIDSDGKATATAAPAAAANNSAPKSAPPSATPGAAPTVAPAPSAAPAATASAKTSAAPASTTQSPAVRKLVAENDVNLDAINGSGRGGRVTKGDVLQTLSAPPSAGNSSAVVVPTPLPALHSSVANAGIRRVEMSTIRRRIAERLIEAQSTAAILTTFNEIDMSALKALREKYKEAFTKKYGVNLGMMSFFAKAVIEALKAYPDVNASIEGNEILYKDFYHIGIAVGTKRGLVVPVIRDVDHLSMADVELAIRGFAARAEDGKIKPDEMSGGTFTITNGGTYGSMMSTPILNPPQSGILGMHKIEDRPVAINGKVEIRPMMYVALSYDHRLIDGSTSVRFLVKVKECLEDPTRILIGI